MTRRRRAGVMVPLFSLASSSGWGVGEYRDLAVFARWAVAAGQSFIQILPITELPESETSPYSALTAMALDPIFIAVPDVPDFAALGGEPALSGEDRHVLDRVRSNNTVAYRDVRSLKDKWLRQAYTQFVRAELGTKSDRAREFESFVSAHASWLDDYALFRALRQDHEQRPWWDWPEPIRRREPAAVRRARAELRDEIQYRQYLQWLAEEQWSAARKAAAPVQIFGDVPFMISADSPDVWSRQDEFRFDATVGVPPDAFSETGQDWGLPPWRWEVMAANHFAWMTIRARRTAHLFDGFRLDHLVGLYRTYMRPLDDSQEPAFAPDNEAEQEALGERLVALYAETGAELIAEDLGTVPDFVRASLARLDVPGFKVMRWERRWEEPGTPYVDPCEYSPVSVATSGTHDTEALVTWWDALADEERKEVLALPSVRRHIEAGLPPLHAMLRAVLDSPSYLTILPIQDLFGWADRINTPAQVSESNWSWRLPWSVDEWTTRPEPVDRARAIAEWTRAAKR